MTEAEWLACTEPGSMLRFLKGKVSLRKVRLYLCGACRSLPQDRVSELLVEAILNTESFADDAITLNQFGQFWKSLVDKGRVRYSWEDRYLYGGLLSPDGSLWHAANTVTSGVVKELVERALGKKFSPDLVAEWMAQKRIERVSICHLLRDIFGNPFCPVSADPGWLTPTVVVLAHTVYEGQAFDRLPILADALEEAGCDNPDVLSHLRGDGPHVRGCWALDLVLEKT